VHNYEFDISAILGHMKATIRKPYPVYIGEDILRAFDFSVLDASDYVIITDSTVDRLQFKRLQANRSLPARRVFKIVVPKGEKAKSMPEVERVLRKMAQQEIDRDAVILAFGGGAVGDMAGFIASIYKRGIRFVQLPTTFLAQVDSSLGGKTAVNLTEGKNLVGTTFNPQMVISDIGILGSLGSGELNNGYAELIKYGMIRDAKLFVYLEEHIADRTPRSFAHLVREAAAIKLAITEKDPYEKEFRKILNYGHTIGHALEIASDYQLSHGQAIALGMMGEAFIASALNILSKQDMERQNALIRTLRPRFGLRFNQDQLLDIMRRDKKSKRGKLYFVLPSGIGKVHYGKGKAAFPVAEHVVRASLQYLSRLEA